MYTAIIYIDLYVIYYINLKNYIFMNSSYTFHTHFHDQDPRYDHYSGATRTVAEFEDHGTTAAHL